MAAVACHCSEVVEVTVTHTQSSRVSREERWGRGERCKERDILQGKGDKSRLSLREGERNRGRETGKQKW